MRLALPLAIAALCAGLLAGCGGGSSSTDSVGHGGAAPAPGAGQSGPLGASSRECGGPALRVTEVPCGEAKAVLAAWRAAPGCRLQSGASHSSCKVRGYLCISARQGQKAAVSCGRPGRSLLFVPPR
jgi:hypothetical protein